jgi:transcriptional regulator with GAF, ATPase, and Fis domain
MLYRLQIESGTPREHELKLDKSSYRVGRSADADIVIANKNVSGLHFTLSFKGDTAWISDLGSTNGTAVNGKKVRKAELQDGDVISIADVNIVFHAESAVGKETYKTALYVLPGISTDSKAEALVNALRKGGALSLYDADLIGAELALHRRNSYYIEALYSLLQKVLVITDREAMLALLLKEITTLLGLEIGGIFLVEENCFFILEDGALVSENGDTVVSTSVLRTVIDSKRPVVLEHIDSDENACGFSSLMRFNIKSLLCFPVQNREQAVIGVFYCVSKKLGQLRLLENDQRFLNACSTFIALVMENLHLIEGEKARAYERAVAVEERKFTPIIKRLRQEKENLSLKLDVSMSPSRFFGLGEESNAAIGSFVEKAARTALPALITGETGVGKSLLAREIHEAAHRSGPFITIDCTTIPVDLLESELFGHEKGAFTGAHAKKNGKVQAAQDGTLFIDEIGDLSPLLQGKLLRFIQSGEFEPLGGSKTLHSNGAVITATNRDLKSEVAQKKFREDLFYRLNVLHLELPPLRARRELILPLATHFLRTYAQKLNPGVSGFTDDARARLCAHTWPGNIRELENTVMRGLANAAGEFIGADDISLEGFSSAGSDGGDSENTRLDDSLDLKAARERIDRILIVKALENTGRNVSQAAKLLNLSRNSLMDLIKKYGL